MPENYFKRISNIFSKEKNSLNSKENSSKSEDKEAQEVFSKAKINSTPFLGKKLTLDILKQEDLLPREKIHIEKDVSLYPSNIYDLGEGRVALIAYIKKDGKVTVNSFYRSNSQGVWRYLPEYKIDDDGEIGLYSKGYGEESVTLPISIQKALADTTKNMPVLNLKNNPEFILAGASHEAWKTDKKDIAYYKETDSDPKKLDGDFNFKNKKTIPEEITLTEKESPDFSKKITSWEQQTDLYGKIFIEVFPSRDGKLKFMFSRDSVGRVWINGIEDSNSEIQSTGLRKSWVKGGDLTTPAYEYDEMAKGYGNNNMRKGDYVDMYEKYLSKVPVIREYINFALNQQKENPKGEASTQEIQIKQMIHSAQDFPELFIALRKIKGLQGTTEYYEAGDLISLINQVKNGEKDITYITRAGGLRNRVAELIKIEQIRNSSRYSGTSPQ